MKRKNRIMSLTLSALFCALICVGSFIRIPIPNSMPVTLQTYFVLLTVLSLPVKSATLSVTTYTVLGLMGLPVFSGGGGLGYVFLANFGFIIGFFISTVVIGNIAEKIKNYELPQYIVLSLIAVLIIYFIGIIYFVIITNVYNKNGYSFIWFIRTVLLPFLPKEAVCVVSASLSAYKIRPFIIKYTEKGKV